MFQEPSAPEVGSGCKGPSGRHSFPRHPRTHTEGERARAVVPLAPEGLKLLSEKPHRLPRELGDPALILSNPNSACDERGVAGRGVRLEGAAGQSPDRLAAAAR